MVKIIQNPYSRPSRPLGKDRGNLMRISKIGLMDRTLSMSQEMKTPIVNVRKLAGIWRSGLRVLLGVGVRGGEMRGVVLWLGQGCTMSCLISCFLGGLSVKWLRSIGLCTARMKKSL